MPPIECVKFPISSTVVMLYDMMINEKHDVMKHLVRNTGIIVINCLV